jgi:hypothetical protein
MTMYYTDENTAFERDAELEADELEETDEDEAPEGGLYETMKALNMLPAPATVEERKAFFERVHAHFNRKGAQ